MINRAFVLSPLALVCVIALAACSEVIATPAAAITNPTPYQSVQALLDEAADFPAAGDDLTLYIGNRFVEPDARLVATRVDVGRFGL